MSLQSKFRAFQERINLQRYDQELTLRTKRDAVLNRLRMTQTFTTFNQGSYEMGTGVKPTKGDYDIDVGVVFDLGAFQSFPPPKTVKGWVHEAVKPHTTKVTWKEPCVTVQYQSGGEPVYHVDLAVYGKDSLGRLHLARGKEHAAEQRWEHCDPKGLTTAIGNRFTGEDLAQFRRVVQYLKRWKDMQFSAEGNAAPVGIGLTILAHNSFNPSRNGSAYDDLVALRAMVASIAGSFTAKPTTNGLMHRIVAKVPVEPRDDVFARMTDQQATEFKGRVDALRGWLDEAARTASTVPLRRAFGTDFPE
ncbi:MAG: cyclic GMP-AMP synthase DncV-like nucleotidyltransferase [Myxococcota bacterium]